MSQTDSIETVLNGFWAGWSAHSAAAILALWDADDPECSWLSARAEQRLFGSSAIAAFVEETLQCFPLIKLRPRNVHARPIADALGAFFAEVDWANRRNDDERMLGGSYRVSGVVRLRDEGWRICHYAESPLAPIVELRQFYQQIAADGHEGLGE